MENVPAGASMFISGNRYGHPAMDFVRFLWRTKCVDEAGMTELDAHGYGGGPRTSLDAGRRVPASFQKKISDEAREGWSQYVSVMRAEQLQDQEIARQATVIARALKEARKRGVDVRAANSDYIDTLTAQIRRSL